MSQSASSVDSDLTLTQADPSTSPDPGLAGASSLVVSSNQGSIDTVSSEHHDTSTTSTANPSDTVETKSSHTSLFSRVRNFFVGNDNNSSASTSTSSSVSASTGTASTSAPPHAAEAYAHRMMEVAMAGDTRGACTGMGTGMGGELHDLPDFDFDIEPDGPRR